METFRAAFMAKWGVVPWLQTYRQMCIREQEAGDFQAALWWAERGIAIYASDAARAEAVADLAERASEYRAHLAEPPHVKKLRSAASASEHQAAASVTERLRCTKCGQQFERTRTRGRTPSRCPACRHGAPTESR
jgi:predicted Zn-ribbon and HTH transcriptional regulator